jgi:hypothetical protein
MRPRRSYRSDGRFWSVAPVSTRGGARGIGQRMSHNPCGDRRRGQGSASRLEVWGCLGAPGILADGGAGGVAPQDPSSVAMAVARVVTRSFPAYRVGCGAS